jgi:hypothetical protein
MAIDLFPEVKSVVVLSLHIPDASVEVMQKEISNYSLLLRGSNKQWVFGV